MRLLVTTQIVNKNDSNLGFFHEWLLRLAKQVDQLYVVCLFEGDHSLPANVKVISLGKEHGYTSRRNYTWRFLQAVSNLKGQYDGVFVHMNPEYAILGGLFRLWPNKKVLFWYTHKAVNFRLWLAEKFATKIFTATKESFRLNSPKVEITGHGIPLENFSNSKTVPAAEGSLYLAGVGRISRSKDWATVLKALAEISETYENKFKKICLDVAGAPITPEDIGYRDSLFKLGEELGGGKHMTSFSFAPYRSEQMPGFYQSHQILVHASFTGSADKAVLEALAAGRIVVTSSEAYADLADGVLQGVVFKFKPGDYQELAKTIENIYSSGILSSIPNARAMSYVRENHNLDTLIKRIVSYFKS